jgi:hypothetical protein
MANRSVGAGLSFEVALKVSFFTVLHMTKLKKNNSLYFNGKYLV